MFLHFVHRLFLKKIRFGNWICFRPQIFRNNRRWRSPKKCCCVRMHPFMCSPAWRALLLDFTFLVMLNGRSQRYLLPHTDGINRTCFILGNFFNHTGWHNARGQHKTHRRAMGWDLSNLHVLSRRLQFWLTSSNNHPAFWDVVPCSLVEFDQRFRGGAASIMRAIALMTEAVSTSEALQHPRRQSSLCSPP
jgi:hypothetical protein